MPETRYARSGDVHIAYQVLGAGPDLVYVPGWVSHVELCWAEPLYARFLRRLASFSRLVLFDKRGTGLSDRVAPSGLPTLEQRMDDVRAVLDAAGSERAVVLGHSEGTALAMLFAAAHPERTAGLVLLGAFARRVASPDYPWAPTLAERRAWIETVEREWGGVVDLAALAPSVADDETYRRWFASYLRAAASPGAARALAEMNTHVDVRDVLPAIRVPTLLLHRTDDRDARIEEARFIADRIPGARLLELPGADHLPWIGDQDAILDEIEELVTGVRRGPDPDRVLTTIVVVDIVASTERAASLGDRRWAELLERFRAAVRQELARFRGAEMDTAGDGFLATFDGPARAVRFACAVRETVAPLGLEVRAGVHTGECELVEGKVAGIAVHTGARIAACASPGEVLASSTVRDLVSGSGLEFADRGSRSLKGVPGEWRLLAVTRA